MKRSAFLVILCLVSVSLHGRPVTIIHTGDIHSHLSGTGPEAEYTPLVADNDVTRGGWSRLVSLAGRIRKDRGNPVFMFDSGDFSGGTMFSFLTMSMAPELTLMKAAGYDAVVTGNHEFDPGIAGLARCLDSGIRYGGIPPVVISNMVTDPAQTQDDALEALVRRGVVKPYHVIERGGLTIGVFGIMGRHAAGMAYGSYPVRFSDPFDAAREQVRVLREIAKVDLVVCLSHGGISDSRPLSEDENLADKVDGIDVILGGHSHSVTRQPILRNGTLVVHSGCSTGSMGVLDLDVTQGNVRLVSWHVEEVNDTVAGDASAESAVSRFRSMVDRHLSSFGLRSLAPVARISATFTAGPGETPIGHMSADAIRWFVTDRLRRSGDPAPRVDVAFETNGAIRDDLQRGSAGIVTPSDIYRVLPGGYGTATGAIDPLVTFFVTGRELRRALEAVASLVPLKGDSLYLQVSGVRFVYNPNRMILDRVTRVRLVADDGTECPVNLKDDTTLYRVALSRSNAMFLSILGRNSFGILEILPRDRNGAVLGDISRCLVDRDTLTPGVQESPAWFALVEYLGNMDDTDGDGIPDVPALYGGPDDRAIRKPGWGPSAMLAGASWITWAGLGVNLMLFSMLALFIMSIVRRARSRG